MKSLPIIVALVTLFTTALPMYASEDLIKKVIVKKNKMNILVNNEFKNKFLIDDFFVEYDEDIDLEKLDYSLVIMPFIMHVLSAVWISGKDYFVDSMDRDLFYSLKKIKKVMKIMYPKTSWKGNLIPRKVVYNKGEYKQNNNSIALLYSGGVDSTVSSFFHRDKKQLLITAWGQWDLPLNKPELWNTIKSKLIGFAQQHGHTSSFIKSNYTEFFNHDILEGISPEIPKWRLWTVENIGWAGLVAPILYLKGYKVLYIGSSDTWCYGYPTANHPFIDSNISYAGIRLEHDMFDYARLDKLEYLASLKNKHIVENPWVYVCQSRLDSNCCNCSKCLATIMGFLALGENPIDYAFDISPEAALEKVKNYIERSIAAHSLGYIAIDRYISIQNKIRQRIASGEKLAYDFNWLLDINFKNYIQYASGVGFQSKINWRMLKKKFPNVKIDNEYLSACGKGFSRNQVKSNSIQDQGIAQNKPNQEKSNSIPDQGIVQNLWNSITGVWGS